MTDFHLTASELEAYVVGALDAGDLTRVEAHVMACAECQSRLQREASLELAFATVATRADNKRARDEERPRRALPAAAFGVLAMAAAMALWVTAARERSEEARVPVGDDPAAAAASPPAINADAATFTASLEMQADGSRLGVRD